MSETPSPTPLPSPTAETKTEIGEEKRFQLEQIYDEMAGIGVVPVKLIQGGQVIDLIMEENTGASHNRPFAVFEVAHPDPQIQTLIFKVRTEVDPKHAALKEIYFLRRIAPILVNGMPEQLRDKIILPGVQGAKEEGDFPYCLEERVEGKICGGIWSVDPEVIKSEDLDTIVGFIRQLNSLSPGQVKEQMPGIEFPEYNPFKAYMTILSGHAQEYRELLGEEYLVKMQEQLTESQSLIENAPLTFTAGDINPSNMIKTEEGRIGFIDWERVTIYPNPAYDYGFLLADLWASPELREDYLSKSLEANRDVPDFQEHFRLNFIYFRGALEMINWTKKLGEGIPQADVAQATLIQMMKDAIDRKGLWSSEQEASEQDGV